MNPPSHMGNVQGRWDQRSFVYSTGSNTNGVQAVVFLGFNPAIKLQGLQEWGSKYEAGWRDGATRKEEEKQEAAVSAIVNMQENPLPVELCGELFLEADESRPDNNGNDVAELQKVDDFAAMWAAE